MSPHISLRLLRLLTSFGNTQYDRHVTAYYRYFVGTYEARPGAGAEDYTNPSPDYTAGNRQGDGPTGTLTSETFTIGGDYEREVTVGNYVITVVM